MSSDAVSRLWNDHINRHLFALIHSNNAHEKLGGVIAIDSLLDVEGDETIEAKKNLFRLYNYVKTLLPSADMNVMIAASKTLGRIAQFGGSTFGDHFVNYEVPRALQLLQGDRDPGRYAAVLILRELARHSPGHFYTYVSHVLDKIWLTLRDSRVSGRDHLSQHQLTDTKASRPRRCFGTSGGLSRHCQDQGTVVHCTPPHEAFQRSHARFPVRHRRLDSRLAAGHARAVPPFR